MNLSIYKFSASDTFLDFEFESAGPKGKIRKIVRYSPQNAGGITYFNLGFGDLNPKTGKIDDLAVTNNQDREKILATIAATVLEFTRHFPDVIVYAKGSTPARTRLYQIGISANWSDIEPLLHVFGYEQNKGWESFRKNVNYQAFLVKRK
ncbi:MAG TPA: hypothetical protein VNV35_18365 [Puia sp.]|nr:hypothetical protein [Puia sp.]